MKQDKIFNDTLILNADILDSNLDLSLLDPSIEQAEFNSILGDFDAELYGVPSITNLLPGYYELVIIDNLTFCQSIFGPIFISEPTPLHSNFNNVSISDYNGFNLSCAAADDGIISVEVEGGSGMYNVILLDSLNSVFAEIYGQLDCIPTEIDLTIYTDLDGDGITNDLDNDIDNDCIDSDLDGNCDSSFNYNPDNYDADGNCVADVDGNGICEDNDYYPYHSGSMSMVLNFENLPEGVYSILISNSDGSCTVDTISDIALIAPPEILEAETLEVSDVSCFGISDGSFLGYFSGGLPNNWNWGLYYEGTQDIVYDLDSEPIIGVNLIETGEISIQNLASGLYRLDIYDINGFSVTNYDFAHLGLLAPSEYLNFISSCSISLSFEIQEPEVISILDESIEHPCYNASDGVISFSIDGDNPPFSLFMINNSDTTSVPLSSELVTISELSAGDYDFYVIDDNNCSALFNFQVGWGYSFEDNVPSEITINNLDDDSDGVYNHIELPDCQFSYDGFIMLPDVVNENDPNFTFTYVWEVDLDFDNQIDYTSLEDTLVDIPIGMYTLVITEETYGCEVQYDYLIDEEFNCQDIPTAFSPNGDGVNDYWVIGSMSAYLDAQVEVYNRWGDRVFYSANNKEYWDGKYKGKDMPTADYFYIIKNMDDITISHGRVTLRR